MPDFPLAIIIVNWNHGHFLESCLEALLAQDYPDLEIVVVDNGSTDGSPEWVAQRYPEVRLLRFADNRGFAQAFNRGVANNSHPFILSLNPDVVVRLGFIAALLRTIQQDERIGMVAPKLLQADQPTRLDSTGLFIDRRRRPYDRGQGEIDWGQYDTQTDIFGVCGGAALYRRAMLDDLAPEGDCFDEDFFAYYEDADLAWRAQRRGWRAVYSPPAVATHRRGSGDTLRKHKDCNHGRGPRLALCNRYLMTLKNDTPGHFLADLPFILAAELPRLIYTAFVVPQALKGLGDLVRKGPAIWRKRRYIQQRQTVPDFKIRAWFVYPDRANVKNSTDLL